jgi:hypothetical protein
MELLGVCVNHKTASGEPKFSGKIAKYPLKEISIIHVSKVYAI